MTPALMATFQIPGAVVPELDFDLSNLDAEVLDVDADAFWVDAEFFYLDGHVFHTGVEVSNLPADAFYVPAEVFSSTGTFSTPASRASSPCVGGQLRASSGAPRHHLSPGGENPLSKRKEL